MTQPGQASFEPTLSPAFVAEAIHLGGSSTPFGVNSQTFLPFTTVTTDSRKIKAGCLFVALKGEKFDGHDFVEQALTQGARGVICRRGFEIQPHQGIHAFRTENTLDAYRKLAAAWRRRFSIPVAVIAGAVGKTTTKEFLAAILSGKWPEVLKTQGSQNGFVGIPMTLLELRAQHQAAVIEVGIDEIGAMDQHMAIVGATASVVTAIGPEHLETLRDIPTVAREEGYALVQVARTGGTVAIHLDDPWIRPHFSTLREGNKIGFTLQDARPPFTGQGAILSGRLSQTGTQLTVSGLKKDEESLFQVPLPGRHNASNLLAAIAVAFGMGLTKEEIQRGLKNFKGADGRSELRELTGNTVVLCDYYNASPPSMEAALAVLAEIATRGGSQKRKWACLGDMLELGPGEEKFHRDLAKRIMENEIDHVLLYGPRMAFLRDELTHCGYKGTCQHFDSHAALAAELTKNAAPGDAILIKGSRGMKMEEIWKLLESHAQTSWAQKGKTQGKTS